MTSIKRSATSCLSGALPCRLMFFSGIVFYEAILLRRCRWESILSEIQTLGALLFRLLRQEVRQLRADFVRDHLPDLTVFRDATLCGIGYIPARDPLRRDHVAELRHIHLRYILEFDVRKCRDVFRLMAAEVVADLTHGFHRLLIDFFARLHARAANF